MPRRIGDDPTKCARCKTAPRTGKSYCGPCKTRIELESRKRRGTSRAREYHKLGAPDCSRPPAPPPGFDERDLHTGRPLL
jgi:hypothetical protein